MSENTVNKTKKKEFFLNLDSFCFDLEWEFKKYEMFFDKSSYKQDLVLAFFLNYHYWYFENFLKAFLDKSWINEESYENFKITFDWNLEKDWKIIFELSLTDDEDYENKFQKVRDILYFPSQLKELFVSSFNDELNNIFKNYEELLFCFVQFEHEAFKQFATSWQRIENSWIEEMKKKFTNTDFNSLIKKLEEEQIAEKIEYLSKRFDEEEDSFIISSFVWEFQEYIEEIESNKVFKDLVKNKTLDKKLKKKYWKWFKSLFYERVRNLFLEIIDNENENLKTLKIEEASEETYEVNELDSKKTFLINFVSLNNKDNFESFLHLERICRILTSNYIFASQWIEFTFQHILLEENENKLLNDKEIDFDKFKEIVDWFFEKEVKEMNNSSIFNLDQYFWFMIFQEITWEIFWELLESWDIINQEIKNIWFLI